VIFAEGASETIMRVALSVMRKNEEKILACSEFEDVMQLLLSRGLWDCYHYSADDFVNDFVSLTGVVTNESLQALKASYQESKEAALSPSSDVGSAASRFLGRLWSGTASTSKSSNMSPGLSVPARPVSFLRRSASKQSIASTLNSMECGAESIMSSASTDATTVSRDSSNTDSSSIRVYSVVPSLKSTNNDKNLHGQIEDLLTALSEMQRDHAILATQLQREREEREEDRQAVTSLLDALRLKTSSKTIKPATSLTSLETITPSTIDDGGNPEAPSSTAESSDLSAESETPTVHTDSEEESHAPEVTQDYLSQLLDTVEERFAQRDNRRSSMLQSKAQLRDELARSKEQLIFEVSKSQELSRRLNDMEQDLFNHKDQVKEGREHLRSAQQERQRLEKQIQDLRARKTPATSPIASSFSSDSEWLKRASVNSGLRELRLGRTNSMNFQGPAFNKRTSSLHSQVPLGKENEYPTSTDASPMPTPPAADNDALVLELVQAKTAEAVAKQEAEEAKAKLESLRKMLGMSGGDSPGHRASPSQPNIGTATLGAFSAYMGRTVESKATTPPAATASLAPSGGFWTGWGKRTVSSEKVMAVQDKV
jgi:hypothetical protein